MVATVQEQLRKVNYENFSLMNDACVYQDTKGTGFIPPIELHNISKSFKLPVKDHLLRSLLQKVNTNEDGHLHYRQFIEFINWRDAPGENTKLHFSL